MQLDLFNTFRDIADHNGIILYYHGTLSESVISTISESLKQKLKDTEAGGPKSRKLFSSFIELSQNALHYSADEIAGIKEKICAIAVGVKDGKHFIVCGNLVEKQYVESIRSKIEPLLSMTNEEIKQAYRQQLRNQNHEEHNPSSKGAGLGLLTIARDASEPIEYSLVEPECDDDADIAYFYLKATI
jgi:hypothetical protein